LLTTVFTLSFLGYMGPELTVIRQLLPIILFAALVFAKVFLSDSFFRALESLFAVDGLVFVILVALLVIGPSIESTSERSLQTAVLIAMCLILARLYMAVVPIREVFEAYFWSGILSVVVFIPLGFAGLRESIETVGRYTPFSFHPNLLAFLLAGYFCAMLWKVLTGGWVLRITAGLIGLMCLVIIFFASSRGSLVAMIAGCMIVAGMAFLRATKNQRRRVLRWGFLAAALMLGVAIIAQELEWPHNAFGFVDQVLQLTSKERGIDSGLTGRVDKWKATMSVFSDGTFLLGRGVRSSDYTEALIDNSYFVVLYEIGLIPLLLITWRFLSILRASLKGYFHAFTTDQRDFYLAFSLLVVDFLVNNIVARYLFSIGNPYSLFLFLVFAAPVPLANPRAMVATNVQSASRRLAIWSGSGVQPSNR